MSILPILEFATPYRRGLTTDGSSTMRRLRKAKTFEENRW
jgi:hypothetical protein